MRRLRWAMDGGGVWELDMESPVTMEGTARPAPAEGQTLPLGLSRGPRLTRPKQLDFMHRFMSSPAVPSFAGDASNGGQGLLFHHAHTLHLHPNWSATILEQLHVQKLLSLVNERASSQVDRTWLKSIGQHMIDVFTLGFGTEFLMTPDTSLLLEAYNVRKRKGTRKKAVFQHKFPQHNLVMEAASPGLFVDKQGMYWDVPLSMAVDFASVPSSSGLSYHLCLQHNSGQPKHFGGDQTIEAPLSLLPGLCAKAAISIRKSVDFWRRKEGKLKLVQPYDVLLSDPHVSGHGIIGVASVASLGENSASVPMKDDIRALKPFTVYSQKDNYALLADVFANVSLSAQHGHFQSLFLDLTRLNARLEFPSGANFLSGALRLVENLYHSQVLDSEAIHAVCPDLRFSLQQQIVGPFSFRVDSRIKLDVENQKFSARVDEPVFAIDWALKVLGSAKASFWYAPKRQEAMVELRFFES